MNRAKRQRSVDASGIPCAVPAKRASPTDLMNQIDDVNIQAVKPLIPPACLMEEMPITAEATQSVKDARDGIAAIMSGDDDRLVVIVGPCSIHDPLAALEYADRLKREAGNLSEDLLVVMRVYFEKPRTTVGWKGLINDPQLNGTFSINQGLRTARTLLLDINNLGLPCGVEFLDTISPQFIGDLVSWGAIGARTTESQVHRELASGLSSPVGFKNGTSGDCGIAVDAVRAASHPHHFLSVTKQGLAAIVSTQGNPFCHIILRGGADGPNYSKDHVDTTNKLLEKAKVKPNIMIDCSHGNSKKIHTNQPIVLADVGKQIAGGDKSIFGVMIESHLLPGRQDLPAAGPDNLRYGVSITDACIGWDDTVGCLQTLAKDVKARRALKAKKK